MTPDEFIQELTRQNKTRHVNGYPPYRARCLTQHLLEDHPLSIHKTETLYSLCHDETLGVVMFGPHKVALYLELRELHFCLAAYTDIQKIKIGKTPITRREYLQLNFTDGTSKRIPALRTEGVLQEIEKELNHRLTSTPAAL